MRRASALVAVSTVVLSPVAVACGDDDDDSGASGGEDVNVLLSEFIVEPERESVKTGDVTFVVDNQGGETHEFVVVEAASADDLPVAADGSFDEETFGEDNVLDEIEDIESGDKEELTLTLDPGAYQLLCNVVEEADGGEAESHFAEGMHATLTVE